MAYKRRVKPPIGRMVVVPLLFKIVPTLLLYCITVMNKISAIFYFMSIAFPTIAQEKLLDILPLQDGVVSYSGVVQLDSATKNDLYIRAKKWFVVTYKSAKEFQSNQNFAALNRFL